MRIFKKIFIVIVYTILLFGSHSRLLCQTDISGVPFVTSKNLDKDFVNPPDYAKTRVYWWWLEGYMTKQGIIDDLTAMKGVGITGAIVLDGGSSTYYERGEITYQRAVLKSESGPGYMTEEWRELFAFSCKVADSLGIELSLNLTSGWNDGGPWVTPEHASQKLIWSEIAVEGGQELNCVLPLPDKLLTYEGSDEPYFKPVAVLALKLSPESDSIEPLPWFDIKAVHTIKIPYRSDGLGYDWDVFMRPLPKALTGCHAKLSDVIDISDKVDESGRVKWEVPQGKYLILRFGHTGTGIKVSTHSPGAGGLSIDYMSPDALTLHFNNVIIPVLDDLKKTDYKSLYYLHEGSWELGSANWTPFMEEEYFALNGYDIRKYLPVLAGKIIDSHDTSERFLYDFRRLIADLIHKNHYKKLRELAQEIGLMIHPESGGPHSAPIDALKNLGQNDIPMGEFWTIADTHRVEPHRRLYVKQSASAAHIYGKRFVQAEGPTSIGPHWERDPWLLKPTMDRVFCEGMNRLALHTFTHSPREAGLPGNEYFAGTHINPNITWWDQSVAFFDWTARNSFMLSQGFFVADVIYYYGDNVPAQVPLKHIDPSLGYGYDYDVVNSEVILKRMDVLDGKIILPDGMSYHVLVLPEHKAIKLEVLEKIEQLVKKGATVIGQRPETSVGLRDILTADKKVAEITDRLWTDIDGVKKTENEYGKGKVIWGKDIRNILHEKNVVPDFTYHSSRDQYPCQSGLMIDYIHRKDENVHIYYVVNRKEELDFLNCSFRVEKNMQPELWYPETGEITPVSVYATDNDRVSLPLYLDPYGSVFVVFRSPSKNKQVTSVMLDGKVIFPKPELIFDKVPFNFLKDGEISFNQSGKYMLTRMGNITEVDVDLPSDKQIVGPWKVFFDPKWGGPGNIEFKELISWPNHPDGRVKYYSGTSIYQSTFQMSNLDVENHIIHLNLGELYNLAEVKINGIPAGILWKRPFGKDITNLIKPGENIIEIKVVNLWPNRIIGDQFLPKEHRFTNTNVIKFTQESPLLPSGLIGPVTLSFSKRYNFDIVR